LDFIGKEGVRNRSVVRDPANVQFIKGALQGKGPKDFIFEKANSDDAGGVLKELSAAAGGPDDIKVKDLRTLKAHQIARQAVASFKGPPPPLTGNKKKDVKLIQSAILSMATEVSNVLNNQPTESRDTYVHPEIWQQWQQRLI
jgi:DNA topoisomerase IB